jgi:hypothetical protein
MTCGECKNWNPDPIVSCELLKWFDQNNYVVTYTNAPVSGDTACPAFAPKEESNEPK